MKNFKGIIMSESIYIQTQHIASFSQNYLHDTYMPPKPGCDTTYFYVRNYHFKSKYTPKLEYPVPFFQNFLEEIYMHQKATN